MSRNLQCALLMVLSCGCSVEPASVPGLYTILTEWGGGILAMNRDGTHEMAFIQIDDGTVERVEGTWEYRNGDLERGSRDGDLAGDLDRGSRGI